MNAVGMYVFMNGAMAFPTSSSSPERMINLPSSHSKDSSFTAWPAGEYGKFLQLWQIIRHRDSLVITDLFRRRVMIPYRCASWAKGSVMDTANCLGRLYSRFHQPK